MATGSLKRLGAGACNFCRMYFVLLLRVERRGQVALQGLMQLNTPTTPSVPTVVFGKLSYSKIHVWSSFPCPRQSHFCISGPMGAYIGRPVRHASTPSLFRVSVPGWLRQKSDIKAGGRWCRPKRLNFRVLIRLPTYPSLQNG